MIWDFHIYCSSIQNGVKNKNHSVSSRWEKSEENSQIALSWLNLYKILNKIKYYLFYVALPLSGRATVSFQPWYKVTERAAVIGKVPILEPNLLFATLRCQKWAKKYDLKCFGSKFAERGVKKWNSRWGCPRRKSQNNRQKMGGRTRRRKQSLLYLHRLYHCLSISYWGGWGAFHHLIPRVTRYTG